MQQALINASGAVTVKDVAAKEFIDSFSKHLKKGNKIKIPDWSQYVKTACYKDLAPYDSDWLYVRAASVAYQLYIRGKVGVSALKTHYGGKQRNGVRPPKHHQGAGKVIRYCLKQLEEAGLVGQVKYQAEDGKEQSSGKTLTKKGTTDMDRIASQLVKEKKKAKK